MNVSGFTFQISDPTWCQLLWAPEAAQGSLEILACFAQRVQKKRAYSFSKSGIILGCLEFS